MKTLRRILICLVLLGGIGFAAVNLDMMPDGVRRVMGSITDSEPVKAVTDTLRDTAKAVSSYVVEGTPVASTAEISDMLAQGMKRHEESVTMYIGIPTGREEAEFLLEQVENAFTNVRRDYPEIFWMGLGEYGIQWTGAMQNGYVNLTVSLNYCHTQEQVKEMRTGMSSVVQQVVAAAPGDGDPYGNARYFHDWIVNNTVYDSAAARDNEMVGHEPAFNINGVFLDGLAVCEGYAKAYKILCDAADIPCRIVFGDSDGESHAWNYVRLDGDWYLVDCTADDPVSDVDILRWDYFLQGWDSVADGKSVRTTYTEDGSGYPTLSSTAYPVAQEQEELPQLLPQRPERSEPIENYIERVEMRLTTTLIANTNAIMPGELLGVVNSVGNADNYTYRLTGDGSNDHMFQLDEKTGELWIGGWPLTEGHYEVKVAVEGGNAKVTAVLTFDVQPEISEDEPERYGNDAGPGSGQSQAPSEQRRSVMPGGIR